MTTMQREFSDDAHTYIYPQQPLPQKITPEVDVRKAILCLLMPFTSTHLDVHPKVLDDRDTSMAVGGGRKNVEFHVRRNRRFGRGANSHFVR